MRSLTLLALGFPTVAAPLLACNSLADPDYQGEKLAALHGRVTNHQADTPELKVLLQWTRGHFSCPGDGSCDIALEDQLMISDAPVSGELPARFTLDLFEPPPAYAQVIWNQAGVEGDPGLFSFAFIELVPADLGPDDFVESGYDDESGQPFYQVREDAIHGVARDKVLVYAAQELDPDGDFARFIVNTPISAGYHLLEVTPLTEAEKAERRACLDERFPGVPIERFYDAFGEGQEEGAPGLAELAECGGDPESDALRLASGDLDAEISIEIVSDPVRPLLPLD